MDSSEAQRVILQNHGVRVEAHTASYAAERLKNSEPFHVMGGDARTGIPVSIQIDPKKLDTKKS